MRKSVVTGLLALCFWLGAAGPAWAVNGAARLDAFLSGLDSMRARFVQSLVDAEGRMLEESEGVLLLNRPGRFRLSYEKPYEQLYIADGERVWMYDRDLEQVTVRLQEQALGSTPALLLSGSEPLEKNFTIEELGTHEGYQWLRLKPRTRDSEFEYFRLAMEGDVLRAMEMVDGFGQTTRIYFYTVERNVPVRADAFKFTPPPGVDVVGDAP